MAQDNRQGKGAIAHTQIGVTNADADDAHQHFIGARRIEFHRFQVKRVGFAA
jgi:hypothetical protein